MTGWLIDTTLTTGALIALVLVLRRPVGAACSGPGRLAVLRVWVGVPLVRRAAAAAGPARQPGTAGFAARRRHGRDNARRAACCGPRRGRV